MADTLWTGNTNGAWATATNWGGGAIPLAAATVVFNPANLAGASAACATGPAVAVTIATLSILNATTWNSPDTSNLTVSGAVTFNAATNLNGGTFNGTVTAVAGAIAAGTFNGTVSAVEVTGGTFNGPTAVNGALSGGTFNCAMVLDSTSTVTGGTFNGPTTLTATAAVTGGTFANLLTTMASSISDGDGPMSLVGCRIVARANLTIGGGGSGLTTDGTTVVYAVGAAIVAHVGYTFEGRTIPPDPHRRVFNPLRGAA